MTNPSGPRNSSTSSTSRKAEPRINEVDSASSAALLSLRDALRRFAAERDWDQYHSPKNLAVALSVEAAELLEPFQWLSDESSQSLSPDQIAKVQEEIADVFLYLIRLSDKLDINLFTAAKEKMALNALRYPADKSRGSNKKHTEL